MTNRLQDRDINKLALEMARLCVSAGQIALKIFQEDRAASFKVDGSPVTRADVETQAKIVQGLSVLLPGVTIVGEEDGLDQVEVSCSDYLLVDPLDGTKEFVKGAMEWTVNIGLIVAGQPVAGAVFVPAMNEVYWGAEKAYQAKTREDVLGEAKVAQVREPSITHLTAVCSRDHSGPDVEAFLGVLGVAQAIPAGSSLKMLKIAAGEADFYPRLGPTMAWETAGAHAILRAAGGDLFELDGDPVSYSPTARRNPHFIAYGAPSLPEVVLRACPGAISS